MNKNQTVAIAAALLLNVSGNDAQVQRGQPAPIVVTLDQLRALENYRDQQIQITVLAQHIGSQRMFTFGKQEGREITVLLLNPSVDTANLGDTITITGTVRQFDPDRFARDYKTFKASDYAAIPKDTLVIVAAALRGAEGGQIPPAGPKVP